MENKSPFVKRLLDRFKPSPVASRTRSQNASRQGHTDLPVSDQPRDGALVERFERFGIVDTPTKSSGNTMINPELSQQDQLISKQYFDQVVKLKDEEIKRKEAEVKELQLQVQLMKQGTSEGNTLATPTLYAFKKGIRSKYYRYAAHASIKSKGITIDLAAMTPEDIEKERQKLEEMIAAKGLKTLWKGSKMEIESTLRDVCEKVLDEKLYGKEVVRRRAQALMIIAKHYESTQEVDT